MPSSPTASRSPVKAILGAIVLLAAIAAPWVLDAYDLNLLGRFLALSLTAMGLVLLWGEGGILSLGQGVFFGLGGYAIAMHLKLAELGPDDMPDFMVWTGVSHLPWWWSIFRSPVVAVLGVLLIAPLFAGIIGWATFRRRISGVYFALITQALALAFATLLISQQDKTGGFNGLTDYHTLFGFNLNLPSTAKGIYFVTLALVVASYFGVTLADRLALRQAAARQPRRLEPDALPRLRPVALQDRRLRDRRAAGGPFGRAVHAALRG